MVIAPLSAIEAADGQMVGEWLLPVRDSGVPTACINSAASQQHASAAIAAVEMAVQKHRGYQEFRDTFRASAEQQAAETKAYIAQIDYQSAS